MGLLSNISVKKEEEIIVEQIEIDKIIPDPNQPRKSFDGLEELAQTIKKHGLQNPIHLRKEGEKYIIISGERRWRACKEYADLKVISCLIHTEKDQRKIRFLQLIENIQRESLKPLEEANAYKMLLESGEIKQKELAEEVGISETSISKILRLNTLPQLIQDELSSYPGIPKSVLLEIAREENNRELQLELWEKVKTGDIKKRDDLTKERQEKKGLKKKDLETMDADEIWEIIKKAIKRDKEIIKKIINAAQLEKLMKEEKENG